MRISAKAGASPFEIWTYPDRWVNILNAPLVLQYYGYDQYKQYQMVSNSSIAEGEYDIPYIYGLNGIARLKDLYYRKLIVGVAYKLEKYGTCRLFFKWGDDEILIDDISDQPNGTTKQDMTWTDFEYYEPRNDPLLIKARLSGNGTSASKATVFHVVIFLQR